MSKAARQPGYYWCRFHVDAEPRIAQWTDEFGDDGWQIIGFDALFSDRDFIEIDERPIERQEAMPVYREAQE